MHGAWRALGEGRVRLTYRFDREAELEDFRPGPEELFGHVVGGPYALPSFQRKKLLGYDNFSVRLPFGFEDELELSMRMRFLTLPDKLL